MGRDRQSGHSVAVKLLDPHESDFQRFERESALLTEFSHPGIVRYVAHGRIGSRRYLVMEWVEGQTLRERLIHGFTVRESIDVVCRIAEALAAVHERGIVHRDIKPSNIMFPAGLDDQIKLVDFGIARKVGQPSSMTRTGLIIGTPGYMSPEQVLGERHVDARSDVFSLGCILYACLCGRPAFVATHMASTLTAILFFDPARLDLLCPEAPGPIRDLVKRMLAKDPADRPSNAAAVAAELAGVIEVPDSLRRPFQPKVAPYSHQTPLANSFELMTTKTVGDPALRYPNEGAPVFVLASMDEELRGDRSEYDEYHGDEEVEDRAGPVRDIVTHHSGLSAVLADGKFVAMFPAGQSQAEQTIQAANCALELRRMVPLAPMVIGVGDFKPATTVLDRLVESLIEESFRGVLDDPPGTGGDDDTLPIRLDSSLSEFLAEKFDVSQEGKSHYLRPRD